MNKAVFRYSLSAFFILIALWIVFQNNDITLLSRIPASHLFISVIITFIVFAVGGWQIGFLAEAQYHVKMKFLDVITLPIMMKALCNGSGAIL